MEKEKDCYIIAPKNIRSKRNCEYWKLGVYSHHHVPVFEALFTTLGNQCHSHATVKNFITSFKRGKDEDQLGRLIFWPLLKTSLQFITSVIRSSICCETNIREAQYFIWTVSIIDFRYNKYFCKMDSQMSECWPRYFVFKNLLDNFLLRLFLGGPSLIDFTEEGITATRNNYSTL